jgi:hydrogenase/urease accessory protein HupE
VLIVVGLTYLMGLYPLMVLWPGGFTWEPRQPEYEQMILGVYAVLGIFLIMASRDPMKHKSLIWFTVWSSLVHGVIMLVQALRDSSEQANLLGDVPALILIGVVLAVLMRKAEAAPAS